MAYSQDFKRSLIPGNIPEPSEMVVGGFGINAADGILYTKKTDNTVVQIGSTGGGTGGGLDFGFFLVPAGFSLDMGAF